MSGKQIGKAYLRGCGISLGASAIGAVLGIVLVSFAFWMARDARIEDEWRVQLVVGCFELVLLAGLFAGAAWWVRRRGKKLDRGFAARDVEAAQVQPNLRGWKGLVRGRPFHAWVARGPRLELYLECRVGTRGAIRRVGPTIRKFDKLLDSKMLPAPAPPALADCEVLAYDVDWMNRLLSRPGVARTAAELMARSERVLPGIRFDPSSIGYIRQFLPLSEITRERVDGWLDQLSALADAVEAQGPSAQRLEPSRLEIWARTSRRLPVHPLLIGVGCALTGIGLFLLVTFAVVAALAFLKG